MENLRIKTSNEFSESFERFQDSNLFDRLSKKYQIKPFFERYRTLKTISTGASYFINLFSAITAFTCVFVFLETLTQSRIIAGILSAVFLFGVEAFKRLTIPDFFKNWFQFSQVNILKLLCIGGLVLLSVSLSYMGANDAVKMFSPDAVVTNVDSLTNPYNARITILEKQLKEIKRSQSWKGKLTRSGQQAYNKTNDQIAMLQAKVLELDTHTRNKNDQAETIHGEKIITVAWVFALFTIALDSVLILLLWFLEYYDFRSLAEFAKPDTISTGTNDETETISTNTSNEPQKNNFKNHKKNGADVPSFNGIKFNENRTVITGFLKKSGNEYDHRNNDLRTDQETESRVIIERGTGICKQCQKVFTKNAPKHIYCSDTCRVIAWENQTGKELKRKKVNRT
jgi:hypothetical protein